MPSQASGWEGAVQCTLRPLEGRALLEACSSSAKQLGSAAAANRALSASALLRNQLPESALHSVPMLSQGLQPA